MERERLGSRLGFILLSAGCAIGCGNVWKFPWMCGQYGGGGFVLIYVLCLLLLGLPVMTMEFAVGRAAQASPLHMYQKLERKGQKWHIHGYVAFFGNIALMAFYTVVTGWIVYYFVKFLTGQTENLGFVAMITNPGVNVTYLAVTVIVAFDDPLLQPAGRSGAHLQVYDDAAAGADGRARPSTAQRSRARQRG